MFGCTFLQVLNNTQGEKVGGLTVLLRGNVAKPTSAIRKPRNVSYVCSGWPIVTVVKFDAAYFSE